MTGRRNTLKFFWRTQLNGKKIFFQKCVVISKGYLRVKFRGHNINIGDLKKNLKKKLRNGGFEPPQLMLVYRFPTIVFEKKDCWFG